MKSIPISLQQIIELKVAKRRFLWRLAAFDTDGVWYSPNGFNLFLLLLEAALGLMAELAELGGQPLRALLLSFATLGIGGPLALTSLTVRIQETDLLISCKVAYCKGARCYLLQIRNIVTVV